MFGIFSRKKEIPASEGERVQLVRTLVRLRCQMDDEARSILEFMGTTVDDLDTMTLMSLPEASIMRLVEQHTTAREQGADEETVIQFLNQSHALSLSAAGQELPIMSSPYTLPHYVEHFIEYVHPHSSEVSHQFISLGIRKVLKFYER